MGKNKPAKKNEVRTRALVSLPRPSKLTPQPGSALRQQYFHRKAAMADEGEDTKPKGEQIGLKVKDQDGAEGHFKVKMTTPFTKIFDAYCSKKSMDKGQVRFLFDGQRINPPATPQEMDMEDGDTIDVFMEQLGGRGEI